MSTNNNPAGWQAALVLGVCAFGGYGAGVFRASLVGPVGFGELVASLGVPVLVLAVLLGVSLGKQKRGGSEPE